MIKSLCIMCICSFAFMADAELKLADVFGDNMVLQRNAKVPIWGTADPGAEITVEFAGQKTLAKAGADGAWMAFLSPMPANSAGQELKVSSNLKSQISNLKCSNVLVGEVWLCSGQSNMEWTINAKDHLDNPDEIVKGANFPEIRFFTPKIQYCAKPYSGCEGKWRICNPENAGDLSATAYYFARKLNKELNVPVGLLVSAAGGTVGHCWIPCDAMLAEEELKQFALSPEYIANNEKRYEGFEQKYREWLKTEEAKKVVKDDANAEKILQEALKLIKDANLAEKTGAPYPYNYWGFPMEVRKIAGFDKDLRISTNRGASLFNGMVAPLAPFAIAGILWWQGEADADWNQGAIYKKKLCVLADSWRKFWSCKGFDKGTKIPFIYVQIENFRGRDGINADEWAKLRNSQRECADLITNSAMVVAIDASPNEDASIHPKNKEMLGNRLCSTAMALSYGGDKTAAEYPLYSSMKIDGDKVIVNFKNAPKGLQSGKEGKDAAVKGFEVAGSDGTFVAAEARIEKDSVIISSPSVKSPVAVRYAWALNPVCNLYGGNGLPASPFIGKLEK